jgi:hypothetical protein
LLPAASLRSADSPATFVVSEFTFTRPAGWESVTPSSPMRKAELKVVDDATKGKAEIVFFHFGPGPAGGKKANIDRWFGQFEEGRDKIGAKVEDVTVGKHAVAFVEAQGTYKSGMPGGPQTPMAGYALLGAIIESEQGHVFVKMTGPQALVKSASANFRKMIDGALK